MFIPFIATAIILLIMLAYMSTSGIVSNANEVRMNYEKVSYSYDIEESLKTSIEHLCQVNAPLCKSKEVAGVVTLSFADLSGYIPSNFENSNLIGGTYASFEILNNYTTIRLIHDVPNNIARSIYLKYYKGRKYGISPNCVSGSVDVACTDTNVYHDFASSLELRTALGA